MQLISTSPNFAKINWQDGVPYSADFDDIFANPQQAILESEHVFIAGNQLSEKFQKLSAFEVFTITEIGFGSGLNFLLTAQCFLQHAPKNSKLHYISIDKHPWQKADRTRYLQKLNLTADSYILSQHFPLPLIGEHIRILAEERITLNVFYEPADSALAKITSKVDAWFWDAFAPTQNAALWQAELFKQALNLSNINATLATFSVARIAKDNLQQAGWQWQKSKGFGNKKHMLQACKAVEPINSNTHTHIHARSQREVFILGAGIAGSFSAYFLAKAGFKVHIFDKYIAEGASNIPCAATFIKLTAGVSPHNNFYLSAFDFSTHWLKEYAGHLFKQSGLLFLAENGSEQQRQNKFKQNFHYLPQSLIRWVDNKEASQISGLPLNSSGLFFPTAGICNLKNLCEFLLTHSNINSHWGDFVSIENNSYFNTNKDTIILACGIHTQSYATKLGCDNLRLQSLHGQMQQITTDILKPHCVICSKATLYPHDANSVYLGSSFIKDNLSLNYSQTEFTDCLNHANFLTLEQKENLQKSPVKGFCGIRTTTHNHLPLITQISHKKNIWLNTGHGSKGLVSAPFAGWRISQAIKNPAI